MTNFEAVVFVFQKRRAPHVTRCVYLAGCEKFKNNKAWKHTATIDPAAWMEWLLNHPRERNHIIEGMYV